jgi:hypothetical protein
MDIVDESPSRVRSFDTERHEGRTVRFGDQQLFVTPGSSNPKEGR